MKVLALEPFYGGSHKAFLDGIVKHSSHKWTVLTLPDIKWKWRMRHSAITFAEQVNKRIKSGEKYETLFCSDMLNLAEFKGLVDRPANDLPAIIYFHENQLTYPVREISERDYHFAMINFSSCVAADLIWFNSRFHQESFTDSLSEFLSRMPDNKHLEQIEKIKRKSTIIHPGIDKILFKPRTKKEKPHILWAARWEHDKNPDDFFKALKIVKNNGIKFEISVIGEQYENTPDIFKWAKEFFSEEIRNWGYLPDRKKYVETLQEADIVVSTANHEFYGISIIEAVSAGCYPILPNRLSYPELTRTDNQTMTNEFLYDGSIEHLVHKLMIAINKLNENPLRTPDDTLSKSFARFLWINIITEIDRIINKSVV